MMKFADTSRLGVPYAKDPTVVQWGGRYLLYFSLPPYLPERLPPGGPKGWSIGIAESDDLIHWRKIGEMLPEPDSVEENGICAPGARVLNGAVHLFYQTYGNGKSDTLCHAVSHDGIHFERDPTNPVFAPKGAWSVGRAIDAEVFEHGDRLFLYYATRDPGMKIQMLGAAACDRRSDFGRDAWEDLSRDKGPLLKPELAWEGACIEAPTVCRHENRLFMFYAGAYNNAPQQIGVAISDDALHWTRLSDTPFLPNGGPNEWNASESGHPAVFRNENGETTLFYQGNNDNGKTWYLSQIPVLWKNGLPVRGA